MQARKAERECDQQPAGCEQLAPAPPEQFLRQALGSNDGDVRLPSLLLSAAVVLAVAVRALMRARARSGSDAQREPGERASE